MSEVQTSAEEKPRDPTPVENARSKLPWHELDYISQIERLRHVVHLQDRKLASLQAILEQLAPLLTHSHDAAGRLVVPMGQIGAGHRPGIDKQPNDAEAWF